MACQIDATQACAVICNSIPTGKSSKNIQVGLFFIEMASPSLTYEILMYLNSFYFGMFSACEIGIGILKAVNLEYDSPGNLEKEMALLVGMILIESIRIYFGRHGSLSDKGRTRAHSVDPEHPFPLLRQPLLQHNLILPHFFQVGR